ncbi:hypothetical protein [uncultured Adlercreutzia sp.]|uniref:hypothetical protein n=1 Tax=uncultured Adlercreutzia sp. TaxID=875803 RepID=UPI0025EE708D|nr:hypothetical protein [uncultured Adlercreutzia sp.]
MTPEEFDARIDWAREHGRGETALDRMMAEAAALAYREDPHAAATLSWNHPVKRLTARGALDRWKAVATGQMREASRLYASRTCGECAHAVPAVFCPLTHRMMLAEAHGDPGDYWCEASEEAERRSVYGGRR